MPIQEFPKTLYKENGATIIVASQAAQDALDATWSTTPAVVKRGLYRVACDSATFVIAAPNAKRRTFKIVNDSTAITRILYADGASTASYTWILDPGERWEMPLVHYPDGDRPEHPGLITGISETSNGFLNVTETEFD
jgi:hypothetical protein